MSDFISNIVARSNNQLETVGPRLPSLFEPGVETRNLSIAGDLEQDMGINHPLVENLPSPRRKNQVAEIGQSESESLSTTSQESNQMGREPQQQIDGEKTGYIFHRGGDESANSVNSEFSSRSQVPAPINPIGETQTNFVTNNYFQLGELQTQKLPELRVIQQLITKETVTKEVFPSTERTATTPEVQQINPPQPATKLEQIILAITPQETPTNPEKSPIPLDLSPIPTQTLIPPPQITPQVSVVKKLQPVPEKTETTPTINVTIGRIEIRATTTTPASPSTKPREKPAVMSLEEYLRQRGGGK
ncbi:hypothetical protein NIES4101_36290 [Calothrix sp. NIES-4101]|nr:hypothetical protein NIES4101_36290 [Calothrix sp. NIES-4101]